MSGGLDHQTHGGEHGTVLATRSALNLDGTQFHLEPDQRVVPHGPDRNLDVYEVVHESGGCERLGSTFGPYQSGAGHGATAVGECRTPA